MAQIKTADDTNQAKSRISALRQRLAEGLKWWAEHQAWPATEEIRVDRHRSTCG